MSHINYDDLIPNNVNLSSDRKLKKALKKLKDGGAWWAGRQSDPERTQVREAQLNELFDEMDMNCDGVVSVNGRPAVVRAEGGVAN